MDKPVIAASSYLNTAPLCFSFVKGRQKDRCVFLSDAAPSKCSDLLAAGEVDAAMIPVIEYQRIPGLRVSSRTCVASRRRVRSVILASRVPIEKVRSVALDTSSRTSATLVKILLSRFYSIEASFTPYPPTLDSMLQENDAALIIGDPAMLIDRSALHVYDLAEEWNRHTGLPFVFAFWAVREDSTKWPGEVDLAAAKREGLDHVDALSSEYGELLGLPASDLRRYLTENISFDLDDEAARGLELYYSLALDCGLIPGMRKIVFDEQSES
jgi:chorismate dehydratase